MANLLIKANTRAGTGKGVARKLRAEGKVPAVLYGKKRTENLHLTLVEAELRRVLAQGGRQSLIKLVTDQGESMVLLKDIQTDPVRDTALHVDFHEVALDEEIITTVPIVLIGEEERENDGGIVTMNLRELTVACLPTHIPEIVEVDVSGLTIGDTITAGDIKLEGSTIQTSEEETIVSITLPAAEVEEEDDEAEEGEDVETEDGEEEAEEGEGEEQE